MGRSPFSTEWCKAVFPDLLSCTSTSARAFTSNFSTSACPQLAARWRGVSPVQDERSQTILSTIARSKVGLGLRLLGTRARFIS